MPKYEKLNNVYIPGTVRQDFMQTEKSGSNKGRIGKDPLKSQRQYDEVLTQREIDNIYKNKRIAQNIIDVPAEDATREWIDFEDTPEGGDILNKLNDLDAQPAFQDMIEYERLTGDGFISLGVSQTQAFNLDEELDEEQLSDVDYINPFSKRKVKNGLLDDDPFSPNFNKFEWYELDPVEYGGGETRLVHSTRMLHLQTRVFEGDKWGNQLMQALYEPITILDNFAWSLGQIAYAMTFKVLKSPHINMGDREQAKNIAEELEKFFNTMSMAVIGKNEELTHEGPSNSLPNLASMSEFIWDFLCGSARMPKAHILGQQQGTITGGQYDSLNYYMRISGIQENYIRPLIERLVYLLYKANDSGVGNGQVDEPEFKLVFNPLWKLDRKTDAEIREINAKIDEKYVKNMILDPDEVREARFGKEGFMDKLDLSEEQLQELAYYVDKKRKENSDEL